MELRQLEYFLMVSDMNSFTRAAEKLYVSQPAVTNAIRTLEEELDIQLFERKQRKARLTSEGEIFYRHIKNVMRGISTTLNEINDLKTRDSGLLNVGLTGMAGIESNIYILAQFRKKYPNINIKFTEGNVDFLEEQIANDKLDCAFVFGEPETEKDQLHYIYLDKQELMVCCPRKHPWHRLNSITLQNMADELFILMDISCYYRQFLIKAFEQADTLPQIAFEISHIQTLLSLVASNMGVSILPDTIVDNNSEVAAIPLEPALYISPAVIYKKDRHHSHALEAFLEILSDKINDK